jgi:hypothetical protein
MQAFAETAVKNLVDLKQDKVIFEALSCFFDESLL